MTNYLARRISASLIALLVATFIVYGLLRLAPGDIVAVLLEGAHDPDAEQQLKAELGLNEALPISYVKWLGGILHGDFGDSLWSGDSVGALILDRLPATMELAVLTLLVSIAISFPIGIISAVARGTVVDYGLRAFAIMAMSVPFFWVAVLVMSVPARNFGWSPPIGYEHFWVDPLQNISVLIIPALILGMYLSGRTVRMLRTTMLEVMGLEYIRTARAKGLTERVVVYRHALRNALIPVVTIIGLEFGFLIGGIVIVESIFAIPGMGRLMFDSLNVRDYTTAMGVTVVIAAMVILINLIVDISYGFLNPRMRVS